MTGQAKIGRSHLERAAVIYVRQSSLAQVREHTESTARQYGLVEHAVALGWDRDSIEVIDTDLGISGRSTEGRDGFRGLVSKVCLGEIGAIFGLEISRLARSSADLSRLLELARLTDTLLIDSDGIYDLADFNDRLLLGLKGTMSEAELHLLAGRLQGAKRAAAGRGELRTPLPVGYLHEQDGRTVIDPDEEVATAVADVFAAFTATGSAYGVVAAFSERRFPLRAYGGAWAGQLRWGQLNHARVAGILNNPCYAGAYVFGRYASRRTVDPDGGIHSGISQQPMEQWQVLIPEHHPGYITWDNYLSNKSKLAANRTNSGARPVREGHALCQGIINCGSCGRPMSTRYHRDGRGAYECHSRKDQQATSTCRSISAHTVDDAVTQRLLAALNPKSSSWPSPPPTNSPGAATAPAVRRNWRSSAPATTPIVPSGPSTRPSRRTGSSCVAWKHAGRRNWRRWSKPNPLWPRPEPRSRHYPPGPSCRPCSPTCPDSGRRPAPRPVTANGCCAP